jgi:hypothetical protein
VIGASPNGRSKLRLRLQARAQPFQFVLEHCVKQRGHGQTKSARANPSQASQQVEVRPVFKAPSCSQSFEVTWVEAVLRTSMS